MRIKMDWIEKVGGVHIVQAVKCSTINNVVVAKLLIKKIRSTCNVVNKEDKTDHILYILCNIYKELD